jgi:glycosyltransferase involved in cell wall biosynthesis
MVRALKEARPDLTTYFTEPAFPPGALWEQVILAGTKPDRLLLSLCNSGPVFRRKQIVMLHDAQVHSHPESYRKRFQLWYRLMQPLLAQNAQAVVTVSEHSKRQLIRYKVARSEKIHVVPNGGDHVLRTPPDGMVLAKYGLEEGRYFLAFGSNISHKNTELLLKANSLRERNLEPMVLVGANEGSVFRSSGPLTGQRVKSVGRVRESELRALYQNASAFLLPSLTEGFGLPAAEAMACGCPVIASNGGALPEVVGDAGVLLDPQNPQLWARAMEWISADPAFRNSLAEASLKRSKRFTWARAAQAMGQIIDAVEAQCSDALARPS